jgi:AcrR family transcriptional regulator
MGSKERIERQKLLVRQEILDAAREMFVKEGYTHVSMRKIADKIEYSPTIIYHYFKDKADLLNCICDDTFTELRKRFEYIEPNFSDPLLRLRMGLRAYMEFGLKYPNQYLVAFMSCNTEETRRNVEGSVYEGAFAFIRKVVKDCVKQQKIRNLDVEMASQSLWAAAHGLTSLLIVDRKFPWANQDKLMDYLTDLLIEGLKASAPGRAAERRKN